MDSLTISPGTKLSHAEDYDFLRQQGIKAIEKLSGQVWTNYNHSDPGITLLEGLCYALTDLAYRISMPMEDLLAKQDPTIPYWENNFYTARQILPSTPLTYNDLRKIIIDCEGVLNAWVERSYESEVLMFIDSKVSTLSYKADENQYLCLKGLHKVYVEYEDAVIREHGQARLLKLIKEKLSNHRTLCEDFVEVAAIQFAPFTITATIRLHEGADLTQVQARIFLVIKNFFSPPVSFYSLDEMLQKGYTHDQIFEGPVLRHGFIDDTELEASSEFKQTHLSDLVNLLLDIDEIISITNFVIPEAQSSADDQAGLAGAAFPDNDFAGWLSGLGDERKMPQLDTAHCDILYLRSGDRYRTDKDQRANLDESVAQLNFLLGNLTHARLQGYKPDLIPPKGTFMNTGAYFPVQRTLPHCYNQHFDLIGNQLKEVKARFEVLKKLGPEKILPLQLKGYLMVFEQILANYFSQLSHLGDIFSFDPAVKNTYFTQIPNQIFDLDYLFTINTSHFYSHDLPGIVEKPDVFADRRERFLNQLAAGYSEDLSNYSSLMHQLSGDQDASKRLVVDKAAFLKDYIEVSNYRSRGIDYTVADRGWRSDNVSGFEKRLSRMLGISDYSMRNLAIHFIKIHTVSHENGIQRFSVKVMDPNEKDKVLLNSDEYEFEEEAENILNYILKSGWDKSLYQQGYSQNRVSYELNMPTDEGDTEVIAHKYVNIRDRNNHEAEEMLKVDFDRLMYLLNEIAENEGIHIIEHILLRPKVGQRHSSKKSVLDSDMVDLLPLRTPSDFLTGLPAKAVIPSYTFQISSIVKNTATTWKISFQDSSATEILKIDDEFKFYKHVLRRITLIRQLGADSVSYRTIMQKDGTFSLELWSATHLLARANVKVPSPDEFGPLIDTMVHFFAMESFGLDNQPDESDDDPYSYQISVVIPDWPKRFQEASFKHLLEQSIYMETPAHVTVYVLWAGHGQMHAFEEAYRLWVDEFSSSPIPNAEIVNNLLHELNDLNQANSRLMAAGGLTNEGDE